MVVRADPESELARIEEEADARLAEEERRLDEQPEGEPKKEEVPEEPPTSWTRAAATSFPVLGAAIMLGGIFAGISPRFYASVAGLMGIALAAFARRIRQPPQSTLVISAGVLGIGFLMLVPTGFGNIFDLRRVLAEASAAGNLLRPPVPFVPGWHAVIGWVMGAVGFQTGWVALSMRRPTTALLVPLPVMAIAAISVPEFAQVASGLAALALFALALGFISAESQGAEDEKVPLDYQLRKAARGLPMIAVVTLAVYALTQTDLLFPDPLVDPAQEPQKPKAVPLTEVEDRVLFEVESSVSGPWRVGSLDVYDGTDWRLPPFAQSQIKEVPKSGIVKRNFEAAVKATFTIAGLGGAVLPTLPNTVFLVSRGPSLAFDARNDNIRIVEGQIEPGLTYDIGAAGLPSVGDLKGATKSIPKEYQKFTEIPDPPRAVSDLIAAAPKSSKWEEFDFVRNYILENVVVSGVGTPKSVPPDRVADMVGGSKQGTPFEIVAAQAMLARWVGVPSRIGYGFDGGDEVGKKLQIRPSHGSAFVEVFFPDYGWLPVIGTPKKAKATSSTNQQRVDPNILPSEDIGVQLVFPVETPARSVFVEQVRLVLLIVVPLALLALLIYFLTPGVRKALFRSKRRNRARADGPAARISVAYADWRDWATDIGAYHPGDTPFRFLQRFPQDEEHSELAWLTTRTLWGDLSDSVDDEMALHAEELSRSLRRRMALAQPATIRSVAMVSRLSLRNPYSSENGHAKAS
jgi:hypothetical protein